MQNQNNENAYGTSGMSKQQKPMMQKMGSAGTQRQAAFPQQQEMGGSAGGSVPYGQGGQPQAQFFLNNTGDGKIPATGLSQQALSDLSQLNQDQQQEVLKQLEAFGKKQLGMLSNSNSSKFIQILNNVNININNNYNPDSNQQSGVQQTQQTHGQAAGVASSQQNNFISQQVNAGMNVNSNSGTAIGDVESSPFEQYNRMPGTQQQMHGAGSGGHHQQQQHPLQNQQHASPQIGGNILDVMQDHPQQNAAEGSQRLQLQSNFSAPSGPLPQHQSSQASVGESQKGQPRMSMGSKGTAHGGGGSESKKGIAGAVYSAAQQRAVRVGLDTEGRVKQSQESFLPYEENSRGKRGGRDGAGTHSQGLSQTSSQKQNGPSVNTNSMKISGNGGTGWADIIEQKNINTGANISYTQQNLGGSIEGVAGLHAQGSQQNGLQFQKNYQPQPGAQQSAPFRRKASNTNKQSFAQIINTSLQHDDEMGKQRDDVGSSKVLTRHKIPGLSSQGIEMKGNASNTGANYQSNLGMRLNLETVHPQQISGIGVNYNKGGGTFVAAKGLASVNRPGNKFINSKNANISKAQFEGAPAVHQNQRQHSNSLGRDSLKSAGGMVNFEQQVAPTASGAQALPPQAAKTGGNASQNPNQSSHGGPGHVQAHYSRQTTSNAPGNQNVKMFKLNELRDLSKQKHENEVAQGHGSQQPRTYDSLEDDHPYLPYQNQTVKITGTGTNSSTINTRIGSNQLQSSLQLNSGIGSLAGGATFVGGRNPNLNSNSRAPRDNSGASHNVNGGNSVGPQAADDLNGSENSNANMKLIQDHTVGGSGMPYHFNKSGVHIQPDYNNSNKGSLNSFKAASYTRKMSPDKSNPLISKQSQQQYSLNRPSHGKGGLATCNQVIGGQVSQPGSREASGTNTTNMSPPRQFELIKNHAKNKFDVIPKHHGGNGREGAAQHQGPIPLDYHLVNQSQNFQNSGGNQNGRMINRSQNKGGIANKQDRMQERHMKMESLNRSSQISSTSNFNKGLNFGLPQRPGGLNTKNSGTDSITLNNLNRSGTNHNKQRNGIGQMTDFDKRNPVCNDEDDVYDEAVYENDEFETVDNDATNFGAGVGQAPGAGPDGQKRGNSGTQRGTNNQFIGNNTFYAGQQNTKFFDKRILASQKQNRPKNTFGPAVQNEIDQSSQGHSGYSPHIKQQKQGKKNQNLKEAQRVGGQPGGGAVLPSVNESHVLPSLSRTGNNFNQNVGGGNNINNRMGDGGNGQRVASRRTSTRQKAEIQGARMIQSRQRQEQYMNNENPQNVYTMNNEKISPDQSHSKITFSGYNHSQPRGQTQGQLIHPGSISRGGVNNKNSYKIKELPLNMENEPRENMNLAQYNFNRMDVIDEEEVAQHGQRDRGGGAARRSTRGVNDQLMSAGQDRRGNKNMHNTTTNFYPQRFGDRLPTRGDVQSRGRQNLIPSAQGTRHGNSRADNSFGRVQQMQINQAQPPNRSGTHYGAMFQESTHKSLIGVPGTVGLGLATQQSTTGNTNPSMRGDTDSVNGGGRNASIGKNSKSIPLQVQNKSRIRMSTESVNTNGGGVSAVVNAHNAFQQQPYQSNLVNQIRDGNTHIQQQPNSGMQHGSKGAVNNSKVSGGQGCLARRNSQMNERDSNSIGHASGNLTGKTGHGVGNAPSSGSINRVSGPMGGAGQGISQNSGTNTLQGRKSKGQRSGMNIGNFDDFDQYSGSNGNQYDHGFDPPSVKLDSGRGVSSGFNKNSAAMDGFSLPHNHMFDIEEDNEDQFNDQHYQ